MIFTGLKNLRDLHWRGHLSQAVFIMLLILMLNDVVEVMDLFFVCMVCIVIDCGSPPSVLHADRLSATITHYSSELQYGCREGFQWKRGQNSSVCGLDGKWHGPSLVCEGNVYI